MDRWKFGEFQNGLLWKLVGDSWSLTINKNIYSIFFFSAVVNNNKSNNITVDTLNVCADTKTENENTRTNNSIFAIEDENDSFSNTNSSLFCSINEKNTTFQNNYDKNPSHHNEKYVMNIIIYNNINYYLIGVLFFMPVFVLKLKQKLIIV